MTKRETIKSILAAEMVLLIPLIAMAFSSNVNWGIFDFIIIGALLAIVGIAYRLIVDGIKSNSTQVAIGIMLAAVMILLWVEMAVGLFGSPIAGS